MKISDDIRARFAKDMGLPIQIIKDPYFSYYIELFDTLYNSEYKYDLLKNVLSHYGEDNFCRNVKLVRDSIVNAIESTEEYKTFNNDQFLNSLEFSNEKKDILNSINSKDIYTPSNADNIFISLDIIHGNFVSLKHYNPKIMFDHTSYDGLLREFCLKLKDYDPSIYLYLLNSKSIRQIIFGKLNPRKQQQILQMLTKSIVIDLVNEGVNVEDICSMKCDEIIIKSNISNNYASDHLQQYPFIRKEVFRLEQRGSNKFKFFLKYYLISHKSQLEIKGVNSAYIPEVIKFLSNKEIEIPDRLFMNDGRLCKFEDSLF